VVDISQHTRQLTVLKVADVENDAGAGVSGLMLQSGAALARGGHDVWYLFQRDILAGHVPAGVRRLVVPWAIAIRVWGLARRRWIDVVEIHEPRAAAYCLLRTLLRARGLPPCVIQSHGLEERFWRAQLDRARSSGARISPKSRAAVPVTLLSQARYALAHASAVIVLNTDDAAFLLARGRDPETVVVAPPGVDAEFLAARRNGARGPMRAAFIGSWIDRKGVPELVSAWTDTIEAFPDARLSVLGAGAPEAAVLDHFPAAVRASVAVVPRFERSALTGLLEDHDVFVLPSWFEGVPLSTLEAAAAGMACLVSDASGHREVFGEDPEHRGGVLVPAGDAGSLAAALRRLASDSALRAALGARARETARGFTWERTAQRSLKAYREACACTGSAILHRPRLGWRRRHVIALLGLRPPAAEHSEAEAQLLVKYGSGARCAVEIGVSEGGSAYELAQVAAPDSTLYLVDPYFPAGSASASRGSSRDACCAASGATA